MAAPDVHHLFHSPIADHSFSTDRKSLAVARDSNVELYQTSGNKFSLTDELKGHEKTVTGVDIAPKSGRIVTCSQDRNAYVWERTPAGWKPTLVLLRINRAATFVRWSPSEQKFAVGSGARVISVCYFEEENDWWISKHLKKPIRSTITTLAWHPNSVLLAAGSTDSHARVLSSFIKGVDTRPEPSAWGERLPFNTICGEFLNDSAGWIHGVSFSPSGNTLAFTGHDSSITVVYPSAPEQPPRAMLNIPTRLLPMNSLIWNGENEIIAAGHDCEPIKFRGDESAWQFAGTIENKQGAGASSAREESALNMFRQMDLKGQTQIDTQLKTVHQNTINTIRVYEDAGGAVRKFSKLFDSLDELARIVDVSYCVGATGVYKPFRCLSRCGEFENFELVTTWTTGPLLSDSCGYIALSRAPAQKRIIVAFRGTYSLSDTIVDLSAFPQPYVPYPGPDPGSGDRNGNGTGPEEPQPQCINCTVHAGFMMSWRTTRSIILDHISDARVKYPDYKLILVGHSLGGAVAALAGLEMRLRGWEPEVTTFGEPRVGNGAFAGFVDGTFELFAHSSGESARRFRRVTHVDDPVPLLPLDEWGYRMHAGEIFISKRRLSPSVSDLRLCDGDQDRRCIAGAESLGIVLGELKSASRHDNLERRSQTVLSDDQPEDQNEPQLPFSVDWRFIPAKYRLWQLLFAHRDYFARLGLCVPGGDPIGRGS
ncbi:3 complex [Aspergillus sp. HF37]|nr:3 complex [Aspergillus sp. HF37]